MLITEIILEADNKNKVVSYLRLIPDDTLNTLIKTISSGITEDEKDIDSTVKQYINSLTDEEKELLLTAMKKESLKRKSQPKKPETKTSPKGGFLVNILSAVVWLLITYAGIHAFTASDREAAEKEEIEFRQDQEERRKIRDEISRLRNLGDKDGWTRDFIVNYVLKDADLIYDWVFSKNYRESLIDLEILSRDDTKNVDRYNALVSKKNFALNLRNQGIRPSKSQFTDYLWLNYHRQGTGENN